MNWALSSYPNTVVELILTIQNTFSPFIIIITMQCPVACTKNSKLGVDGLLMVANDVSITK